MHKVHPSRNLRHCISAYSEEMCRVIFSKCGPRRRRSFILDLHVTPSRGGAAALVLRSCSADSAPEPGTRRGSPAVRSPGAQLPVDSAAPWRLGRRMRQRGACTAPRCGAAFAPALLIALDLQITSEEASVRALETRFGVCILDYTMFPSREHLMEEIGSLII